MRARPLGISLLALLLFLFGGLWLIAGLILPLVGFAGGAMVDRAWCGGLLSDRWLGPVGRAALGLYRGTTDVWC